VDARTRQKRKEWPAFSRFFALGVNQLNPVHEGKKTPEVFMNSFLSLEFSGF
jgi:hypothetical protein